MRLAYTKHQEFQQADVAQRVAIASMAASSLSDLADTLDAVFGSDLDYLLDNDTANVVPASCQVARDIVYGVVPIDDLTEVSTALSALGYAVFTENAKEIEDDGGHGTQLLALLMP
jgi:hypothetical protein